MDKEKSKGAVNVPKRAQQSGIAGSSKHVAKEGVSTGNGDEGIRPEDLNTENDQGASR